MTRHHWLFGALAQGADDPGVIDEATDSDNGTSSTLAPSDFSGDFRSGARLVLVASANTSGNPVLSSVTQTGATWTRIPSSFVDEGTVGIEHWVSNVLAGTETNNITATFSSGASTDKVATVYMLTNLKTDAGAAVVDTAGTDTGLSTAAATTSVTAESQNLAIGSAAVQNDARTLDGNPTNAFQNVISVQSDAGGGGASGVIQHSATKVGSGVSESTTFNLISSDNWATSIVEYKHKDFVAPGSGMAIIQSSLTGSGTESASTTLPGSTTAGNTLIAVVCQNASSAPTWAATAVSQSGQVSFSRISSTTFSENGSNTVIEMWAAQDINGGISAAITMTGESTDDDSVICVLEVSGGVTAGNPAPQVFASGDNNTADPLVSGTASAHTEAGFVIAGFVADSGSTTFSGPTNSFTIERQGASGAGGSAAALCVQVLDQTSAASAQTDVIPSVAARYSSAIAILDPA